MKLSEAIRLGAMLRPQAYGAFRSRGATCAFGAAMEAAGDGPLERWPVIQQSPAQCPACDYVISGSAQCNATGAVIVHLNDDHRWTRETIADWVEGLEQAQEQPASTNAVDPGVQSIPEGLRA